MVKNLDENGKGDPFLLDHIGLDLWRPALAWRARLTAEMVARGHDWYGDARHAVAAALHPNGMPQSVLVTKMGMTKQAVQQLLDGLEADGIVRREPDPNDRRGKLVVYTAKGRAAVRDSTAIKRTIERDVRQALGDARFEALKKTLREVTTAIEGEGAERARDSLPRP